MSGEDEARGVLGSLEAEVMQVMWASEEPMSVRSVLEALNRDRERQLAYTTVMTVLTRLAEKEVLEALNRGRERKLAYTTVMTVLTRLAEKEVLERRLHGRGYVYQPVVSDAAGIAVRSVVRDFGDAALAHFVDYARDDPELLDRLTKLLDDDRR